MPLCYALLGWPTATAGLLLTAWLTQVSIKIMMRCGLLQHVKAQKPDFDRDDFNSLLC